MLNAKENEHVEVYEVRGFMADDLEGALQEAYAASKGTRAKTYLFSLSLNPPPKEHVSTKDFEAAIERAEERLGLKGQPRAIAFHERRKAGDTLMPSGLLALRRDRGETDSLAFRQLDERQMLHQRIREERKSAALEVTRLHQDIARVMERRGPIRAHKDFDKASSPRRDVGRDRGHERDFEPEPEL